MLDGPFSLVGWSYGGLLAMEAARDRADFASIILYEPVSRPFAPAAVEPIRRAVDAGDLDQAVEHVLTKVSGASPEQVAELRRTPAWAYLEPLAVPAATELSALNRHEPDFGAYSAVGAPLAVLVGSLNEGREPYGVAARRFLDLLPGVGRITLPGQGHLAHVEAPDLLADVVDALLASV